MCFSPKVSAARRARWTLVLAALAGLLALQPAPGSAQEVHDLLITGGRVLDGTGNPWFAADVAVRDGRIVAVGRLAGTRARDTLDAGGLYLAPGFIDIHSHADDADSRIAGGRPSIRSDSLHRKAMPNIVAQGVTTIAVNHDGRSPWPILDQRRRLEDQGTGGNVLLLVGHGQVRREVMGSDHRRRATDGEVDRMRALVRQGLSEGAVGISAGLEYVPGRWSDTDEVAALVAELAPVDGVYISHERSEGADPMWYWPSQDPAGPPTLLDAVQETIEIGRRTGVRVVASHIKAKGAHYWGSSHAAIQLIEGARSEGVRIWADQYPYATSGSDGSTVLIPRWALTDDGRPAGERRPPAEVLAERLEDPLQAAMIRRDVAHEIRRRGGADRVVIFEYPDTDLVGRSLSDVAGSWGLEPVETALQLQFRGDPERRGGGRFRGFSMSEDDVEAYAARPWVATASDGGLGRPGDGRPVHPRFFGTFPRKIARYVRDRGTVSLEEAVRSMTSLPALILGLRDRGQVREGFHADLVVFDLEVLRDEATFFEPEQYPSGIRHVWVGGEAVIRDGRHTWALPGRVLTLGDRGVAPAGVSAGPEGTPAAEGGR